MGKWWLGEFPDSVARWEALDVDWGPYQEILKVGEYKEGQKYIEIPVDSPLLDG